MGDDIKSYGDKLKLWAMYVVAVLLLSVASALAHRWLGREVQLPPPPIILVTPGLEGELPNATVLYPIPKP